MHSIMRLRCLAACSFPESATSAWATAGSSKAFQATELASISTSGWTYVHSGSVSTSGRLPSIAILTSRNGGFRGFAASSHTETQDERRYHHAADETLDLLHEKLEAFVEELDVEGSDIEFSQGVLTVKLGKHGTYVINKQTPNRQIWMSSPVSGPFRYDLSQGGRWLYNRDGRDMVRQLEAELGQLLGATPSLG